jgi:cytochrome oxidase Cu insertion factor (SCO1/SenC/PrrC family)
MGEVVDYIGKCRFKGLTCVRNLTIPTEKLSGSVMQPIFISCDPARDTVEQTRLYVRGTLISNLLRVYFVY